MVDMKKSSQRHSYKELRLQQLRSLCETARLGSLTAAAEALGLAQPTVWEQVHGLEREFGLKLIERRAHGCRLTDEGRVVVDLAAPLVAGVDALKRNVQEVRRQQVTWLTLAATQRILVEDISGAVWEFDRTHPHIRLRLVEMGLLSPEEAENHPRQSELYQAIGGRPELEPSLHHLRLKPGDWLLLCTDGLSNQVPPEAIKDILLAGRSAESAARRLVNFANFRGAADNVTVVVVRAS